MSTNFVSTIVYEEGKIFKWLLKEQKRLVKQCKEQRDSYYLIHSPGEYKEKANHLDNQAEVEEILDFLCDASKFNSEEEDFNQSISKISTDSDDDQYLHGQSEEHAKDILQIIRKTIYSIQEEQKELLSYANLCLERIENRFKVYVHEYITKDDDKNEDKTISIEKESEQKILPDDNQCSNDIESGSTANANNPVKEPVFNSIEEKKQASLANDDPSAVEIANDCEARDGKLGVELDIEMALLISELEEGIDGKLARRI